MITHTQQEVLNKAASDLGTLVPGEALDAVQQNVLVIAYQNVLAEISKIIAINDPDEVPALVFESVAILTALFAASDFSNSPRDTQAVENEERRLRYLIAQTPTYEPVMASFF